MKRFIDMPEIVAPPIEIRHVEVPKSIENYLERKLNQNASNDINEHVHKTNKKKRHTSDMLGSSLDNLTNSVAKKAHIEVDDSQEKSKSRKNKKNS